MDKLATANGAAASALDAAAVAEEYELKPFEIDIVRVLSEGDAEIVDICDRTGRNYISVYGALINLTNKEVVDRRSVGGHFTYCLTPKARAAVTNSRAAPVLDAEELEVYNLLGKGGQSAASIAGMLDIHPANANLYLHILAELGLAVLKNPGKTRFDDVYRIAGRLRLHSPAAQPTKSVVPTLTRKGSPPQVAKKGKAGMTVSYDSEEGESIFDDPGSKLNKAYFKAIDIGKRSMMLSLKTDKMLDLTKYAISNLGERGAEKHALTVAELLSDCGGELSDAYDRNADLTKAVDDYKTELVELFEALGVKLDWKGYKPNKPML